MEAITTLGARRVCYGSDEPYRRMDYHTAGYLAMLRDLPPEDRADVMGINMMRLLGLKLTQAERSGSVLATPGREPLKVTA